MKLSILIFNFGMSRLRNLWYTLKVINKIRNDNPSLNKYIDFIVVEHGEEKYSKKISDKLNFKYIYHFDPLLTSHRSTLRNIAVENSETEWVILHDNDIIPTPDFFDKILKIINIKDLGISYFSNFKDVINLTDKITNVLIRDIEKGYNKFKFGYINGTNPEETRNFRGMMVRPHGFFQFTEATGGSFTIKKDLFLKHKFNDDYDGWGAEDNAFKLEVLKDIGWNKFGMINQTLLHSYHNVGAYDENSGNLILNTQETIDNRNRLFGGLQKSEIAKIAEDYEMVHHPKDKDLIIARLLKEEIVIEEMFEL